MGNKTSSKLGSETAGLSPRMALSTASAAPVATLEMKRPDRKLWESQEWYIGLHRKLLRAGAPDEKGSGRIARLYKAAEEGDAEAQFSLGDCLRKGIDVAKNELAAVYWFYEAALQGNAKAQFNLGLCLCNGVGGIPSEKAALELYQFAAENGHAQAQFAIGERLHKGVGLAKDEAQAVQWYRKAAAQGHAKAQVNLGQCLENGIGTRKDEAQAVQWYRKQSITTLTKHISTWACVCLMARALAKTRKMLRTT